MYPVSEQFISAVKQNTRKYYWSGTITTKKNIVFKFTNDDIVKGSGYIAKQCCGSNEIELGTVYAGELGISLFSDIDRYTLDDALVRLYYHLQLDDGTIETIPMGIFEVSEANRGIKTLELKAYDYMLRFDKSLNIEASSGTPYQFIKTACDACKVEMAQTISEISEFPNGKMTLGIYSDNDIETFRDLLFYVAQVLGCFCQIDRYGKLVFQQYQDNETYQVPQKERFNSNYSDFITRYTAVSSTNLISQTSEYISLKVDDALTMNLGVNPLMQFGLKATRDKMLEAILQSLQTVNYVPFDSTTIGNPALDPGDILRFTGGHADDSTISCITKIEYKINGQMKLKCVGKNPRLASAKSKNDKNITGLLNSVESGKTIIYNFVNVSPFNVAQAFTKVMEIDFTATEETSAAFQCEMLLKVIKPEIVREDNPELSIVYKMNDETIENFMPTKTCLYGKHIITLFFPFSKVIENSANTFSMYLKISSSSISIGEAQIRATISGQGLAAGLGDWNGRININETIGFVGISDIPFGTDIYKDTLSVIIPALKKNNLTQVIRNIDIAEQAYSIDGFNERLWFTEILRTFVLTVVRGRPKYNKYITINNEDSFLLRQRYSLESSPKSEDEGFTEILTLDTDFLKTIDDVEISGSSIRYRSNYVVDYNAIAVTIPDGIMKANGYFELKATTTQKQSALTKEIDTGYMEETAIDISSFEGVKGVEFIYEL